MSYHRCWACWLSAAAVLAMALSVNATVLFEDDFDYLDGTLLKNTANWDLNSASSQVSPITAQDQTISVTQGISSGEDLHADLSSSPGGTIYYSFTLLSVTTLFDDNASYFIHLGSSNGSSGRARVFGQAGVGIGTYRLGISTSGTAPVVLGVDLDPNTEYLVVASYDPTSGVSKMWIDPVDELSPSVSDTGGTGTTISTVALRQHSTGAGTAVIGDVIVATTFAEVVPEPASLVLLAVGTMLIGVRRRTV